MTKKSTSKGKTVLIEGSIKMPKMVSEAEYKKAMAKKDAKKKK